MESVWLMNHYKCYKPNGGDVKMFNIWNYFNIFGSKHGKVDQKVHQPKSKF
jgi:hypothetical protein